MFDKNEFLNELVEVRRRKNINNTEMSNMLGTSLSGLRSIEKGNPSIGKLAKYLEIIGLDLNDVFTE